MANWWYYNRQGEKVGPISVSALKSLAQQGLISRDTLLENANKRAVVAGEVNGLSFSEPVTSPMASALPSIAPPTVPNSSASVSPVEANPFATSRQVESNPFTAAMPGTNRGISLASLASIAFVSIVLGVICTGIQISSIIRDIIGVSQASHFSLRFEMFIPSLCWITIIVGVVIGHKGLKTNDKKFTKPGLLLCSIAYPLVLLYLMYYLFPHLILFKFWVWGIVWSFWLLVFDVLSLMFLGLGVFLGHKGLGTSEKQFAQVGLFFCWTTCWIACFHHVLLLLVVVLLSICAGGSTEHDDESDNTSAYRPERQVSSPQQQILDVHRKVYEAIAKRNCPDKSSQIDRIEGK